MERQVPIQGELAPCDCGRQPKHYHVFGKDMHFLECSPCGVRTAKYPAFQLAVEAWERKTMQIFDVRKSA